MTIEPPFYTVYALHTIPTVGTYLNTHGPSGLAVILLDT